jgi:ABC-type multidrug transport system fused ATPase/permease subunit
MGFIMDGLDADAYDRTYSDRKLIARIVSYFRPRGRMMLLVTVMIVLGSLADTVLPLLLARGVDILANSRTMATISGLVAAILIAGVLSWGVQLRAPVVYRAGGGRRGAATAAGRLLLGAGA